MRTSRNEIVNGIVKNGFDYNLQIWIKDYIIQECGHPDYMRPACCNAGKWHGRDIRKLNKDGKIIHQGKII